MNIQQIRKTTTGPCQYTLVGPMLIVVSHLHNGILYETGEQVTAQTAQGYSTVYAHEGNLYGVVHTTRTTTGITIKARRQY